MTARFSCDTRHDTHTVSLHVGRATAPEIVRAVVDAIARNTGRSDRHGCLRVRFALPRTGGAGAHMAAAARLRQLYEGPYRRVIFAYETEAE